MSKYSIIPIISTFLLRIVNAEHTLPTTYINSTTGFIVGIGDWANIVTQGTFWMSLLLGFCVIMLAATGARFGFMRALSFTGFIAVVGSLMLGLIGWMSWYFVALFILIGLASVAISYYSK